MEDEEICWTGTVATAELSAEQKAFYKFSTQIVQLKLTNHLQDQLLGTQQARSKAGQRSSVKLK